MNWKPTLKANFSSWSPRRWLQFAVAPSAIAASIFSLSTVLSPSPGIAAELDNPAATPQLAQYIEDEMYYLRQSGRRWIEIDLSGQRLIAWEGGNSVYAVYVSTGAYATPTPTGVFEIYVKYDSARMQGANYDVPDVPYTMYYDGNYAIHGAYWHNSFGTPVSHGCTNVAVDHAAWLYSWASVGTPVVVHY